MEIFCHLALLLGQAFVHHDPRKLQPKPFRQFFDADGEPLKLKADDLYDELERPGTKTLPPTYQAGLNGCTISALPVIKYPLYGCITVVILAALAECG